MLSNYKKFGSNKFTIMSMHKKIRILNIVGARPNFMKIAPLMVEYQKFSNIHPILVHTGQHYDEKMSQLFFEQLEIPRPDINLEVGSGSQASQTAEIMKRFEPVLLENKPDLLLVVGDVNSTLACALVAAKLGVKIAHVEAGLRSFDRQMPEEINRVLTDAISDYLFVSEPSGLNNLQQEGISPDKVFFVGNVMIDTLLRQIEKAHNSTVLEDFGLYPREYAVITLHRPANVDDLLTLGRYLKALVEIGERLPVIFPVHPRTRRNLKEARLKGALNEIDPAIGLNGKKGVWLTDPLSYLDFLKLMSFSRVVLTDSGGIQEETTFLRVPCLTLRNNTERPITVEVGTNILIGTEPEIIPQALEQVLSNGNLDSGIPDLWDGRAAERIVQILLTKSSKH
jgi:UDP-N-acetylglucosamine 2-epimerase (non-hydrolysing)